jgi:uncharacterized protein (DUF2141 family)
MTMRLARLGAIGAALAVAAATMVSAQQPRDASRAAAVSGTATIAGLVQSDTTPASPIRRVVVTLSGPPLTASRTVVTGDAGRFQFTNLPAGRFTVTASKPAYLATTYGATRAGRPGTPLAVAAGGRMDIAIRLPRGAVVSGTIRDARGAPAADTIVRLIDPRSPRWASPAGVESTRADDRGMYRIYGVPPGEFVIGAVAEQPGSGEIGTRSGAEMDALLAGLSQRRGAGDVTAPARPAASTAPPTPSVGFAPTYYPGVDAITSAARIRLAAGEERSGLDFGLLVVPVATIEGLVADGTGLGLGDIQLTITGSDGPRLSGSSPLTLGGNPILSRRPGADGRFTYSNVPPGHYTIAARGRPVTPGARPNPARSVMTITVAPPAQSSTIEYGYAQVDVDVSGQDLSGLSLVLQRGTTFSGRIVFEGAATSARPDPTAVRVQFATPGPAFYRIINGAVMGNTLTTVPPVIANADGTFTLRGIGPGTYTLLTFLPQAAADLWTLAHATIGARDLLDAPVEVHPGDDLSGAVLTFSDRHTEISGTLQTASGVPAPEYVIVAIPADRALWQPGSRRLQIARPDTTGLFSIRDLPAGEYLVAAMTDLDPEDLSDADFLGQLAATAVHVTLADGGHTVQNLAIAAGR